MSNYLMEGKLDQVFAASFEQFDNGVSGRKIFILKEAKKDIKDMISKRHESFIALYLYNQILSLKNIGFLSSSFSRVSPITKRLQLEGAEIIYAVWKSNVYITQINAVLGGKDAAAGVYKVRYDKSGNWKVDSVEKDEKATLLQSDVVNTGNLAINGYSKGIETAARFMPDFIRHGHGEDALGKVYALFYNPNTSAINSDWRSLKNTLGFTTQVAKKLADVLTQTSNKKQSVKITVHENGHALFRESLKLVAQQRVKLSHFTVFYANPLQNLQSVDMWRQRVGMQLAAEKPALVNPISVRQNMLTGNIVSQAVVGIRAQPENAISIGAGAVGLGIGLAGMTAIGTGFVGLSSWMIAASTLAVGQGRGLNSKVIDSTNMALQEGGKHSYSSAKKLIWDPVHKMMARA